MTKQTRGLFLVITIILASLTPYSTHAMHKKARTVKELQDLPPDILVNIFLFSLFPYEKNNDYVPLSERLSTLMVINKDLSFMGRFIKKNHVGGLSRSDSVPYKHIAMIIFIIEKGRVPGVKKIKHHLSDLFKVHCNFSRLEITKRRDTVGREIEKRAGKLFEKLENPSLYMAIPPGTGKVRVYDVRKDNRMEENPELTDFCNMNNWLKSAKYLPGIVEDFIRYFSVSKHYPKTIASQTNIKGYARDLLNTKNIENNNIVCIVSIFFYDLDKLNAISKLLSKNIHKNYTGTDGQERKSKKNFKKAFSFYSSREAIKHDISKLDDIKNKFGLPRDSILRSDLVKEALKTRNYNIIKAVVDKCQKLKSKINLSTISSYPCDYLLTAIHYCSQENYKQIIDCLFDKIIQHTDDYNKRLEVEKAFDFAIEKQNNKLLEHIIKYAEAYRISIKETNVDMSVYDLSKMKPTPVIIIKTALSALTVNAHFRTCISILQSVLDTEDYSLIWFINNQHSYIIEKIPKKDLCQLYTDVICDGKKRVAKLLEEHIDPKSFQEMYNYFNNHQNQGF